MPRHENKKEKKTSTSQNKKSKKKSLKKKPHPRKKSPAHSIKLKNSKKYIKQSIQARPTPIPTHYSFINNNPAKVIHSSFPSSSSPSSTPSSSSSSISISHSISHFIPSQTLNNTFAVIDDSRHLDPQKDSTNLNNTTNAAVSAAGRSSTPIPNADTNQTMQIAGPIIGIFGGIALIAAFLLLSKRRRRHTKKKNTITIDESQSKPPPEYNEEKKEIHSSTYYIDNIPEPTKVTDQKYQPDLLPQQRFSVTETLVDSTSRPSSVCLKAALPQTSATRESWQSVSSSLLSDTVSPTSTLIGTTTTSFMKTAERQLLQHERPSVLDHFDGHFKKTIETYRAQLADMSNPLDRIDEQEGPNE